MISQKDVAKVAPVNADPYQPFANRSMTITGILLGVFLLMLASPTAGQRIVKDDNRCSRCEIELSPRLTFLNDGGSHDELVELPVQVARVAGGGWSVISPGELPMVFGADGRFLRRIGRVGDGPGEFRSAPFVALLPGDSLLVLDTRLLRATVLKPDLSFARSIALPFRSGSAAILQWPARVVVNGVSFGANHVGWPLHLMDFSGASARHSKSFGDNSGELRAGETGNLTRRFFGASNSSFWAGHVTSYRFTRYSAQGVAVDSIRREAAWFPGISPWSMGSPSVPPPPAINAFAVRGDTVWVAARVARPARHYYDYVT